ARPGRGGVLRRRGRCWASPQVTLNGHRPAWRRAMAHYLTMGNVPHKRHTQHRRPDGALYYEELMGEEGFSSDSSLLYHRELPSAIVDSQIWELPDLETVPNHPLRPIH